MYVLLQQPPHLKTATGYVSDWNGAANSKLRFFIGVSASRGVANKLSAEIYSTGGSTHYTTITSSANINDGNWHNAVTVFDGTNLSLYVDGVLVAGPTTWQGGNITTDATNTFFIGSSGSTSGPLVPYFSGNIDEVRIYNRALSAAEITNLYNQKAATFGQANSVALSTGLVGYWPLDGATTNWLTGSTTDLSVSGNSGRLIGLSTTTSPTIGKIGQGLQFTGVSGYVSINKNLSTLCSATNCSISVWVKPSGVGVSNATVSNGTGVITDANGDFGILRVLYKGVDALWAQNNDGAEEAVGVTYTPNVWTHIVAVHTGGVLSIYKNGVFASSTTSGNSAALGLLNIGRNWSGGGVFKGGVDDVRVYNRGLSAVEIATLYQLGSVNAAHTPSVAAGEVGVVPNGLVGHWTFDGGATNWKTGVEADQSGQGNNGQLLGMSTTTSVAIGKIGQALKFNGSNYISMGNFFNPGTNSWSFGTWFKSSSNSLQSVIAKSAANSTNYRYAIELNDQHKIDCLAVFAPNVAVYSGTNSTYNDGKWHSVMCVANRSGNLQMYYDGALVASTDISPYVGQNFTNTSCFEIGAYEDSSGNCSTSAGFVGSIDETRVYNRALFANEVAALYAQGK
jgi:hypothetical protein